jgi:hypothetical protein
VYEPALQRTLLVGGLGDGFEQVWAFDGSAWTRLPTEPALPALSGARAAYDTRLGAVVVVSLDGWFALGRPGRVEPSGPGCPGTDGVPFLTARGEASRAGPPLVLDIGRARPGAPVTLWLATRAAEIPFASGCHLRIDPSALIADLWLTSSEAGFVSRALGELALLPVGTELHVQAAAVDPGAPAGIALTDALRIIVGE